MYNKMFQYKTLAVNPIIQWSFPWSRYNWHTINLLNVEFEDDRMFGNVELTMIVFGFGVRLVWTYNSKKNQAEINSLLDKALNKDGWRERK